MPHKPIRLVLYGLGKVGLEVARALAARPAFKIIGAIDPDHVNVGRDLGDVLSLGKRLDIKVTADTKRSKSSGQIVVLSSGPFLLDVLPTLEACVRSGQNVISNCEELVDASVQHEHEARTLNDLAKEHNVSILGTSINPGYAMDRLPLFLSEATLEVKQVRVKRIVDISRRPGPMQKRLGIGTTAVEFRERAARGEIRQPGLLESVALIARGLGWELEGSEERIEPTLASAAVRTDYTDVPPKFVSGIRQTAYGWQEGRRSIDLELLLSVDAGASCDEIWIEGRPSLHSRTDGLQGDAATAAVMVNSLRRLLDAPPGLITTLDLPPFNPR